MTVVLIDTAMTDEQRDTDAAHSVAAWLGRNVMIAADFVSRRSDGLYAFEVHLDAPADRMIIDLLDANGLIVHTITAPAPETPLSCTWDGASEGNRQSGRLRIRVAARKGSRPVPTITNVWATVNAIEPTADRGAMRLMTHNGPIAPFAVIRSAQPG